MQTAYDTVLKRIQVGDRLKTPDARTGKPFTIAAIDAESVTVQTARGGRVRISLFTFDSAVKYLQDRGHSGESWLQAKDEEFQALLNMENDRVRAASYVLAILGAARLIDIDGARPNKVRLTSSRAS
jgi:hypothetical protein